MEKLTQDNEHYHNTEAINYLFSILSKKWTLQIIYAMFHQEQMRFKDFEQSLPQLNTRTLTQRLNELESEGFIIKTTNPDKPKLAHYDLSEKSIDLMDTFMALGAWSNKWG